MSVRIGLWGGTALRYYIISPYIQKELVGAVAVMHSLSVGLCHTHGNIMKDNDQEQE